MSERRIRCRVEDLTHATISSSPGMWDHLLIGCEDQAGRRGTVDVSIIRYVDDGVNRYCGVSMMSASPERMGFGSAALPLIIRHLAALRCQEIGATIVPSAEGFWERLGLDPSEMGEGAQRGRLWAKTGWSQGHTDQHISVSRR